MRMKLLGAKDVKGFDIQKHQELVSGFGASGKDEAADSRENQGETEQSSEP